MLLTASSRFGALFLVLAALLTSSPASSQPIADHHQHLFSPTVSKLTGLKPITAAELVALLDAAGIKRAVVLSLGYQFGNPNKPPIEDEYARVKAENDWTSAEIAQFPDRLRGFCGVNPLKTYALEEIARCAKDRQLKYGLKLHFGNSDVDLDNATQVGQLRRVFQAANAHRMAIVVHMRSSVTRSRPYGAKEAAVFLNQLIPAAPDVPIQIAHLAGAGGYDDPLVDEALSVFVAAIARQDPRMRRVIFDVSGVAGLGEWRTRSALITKRIRELGVARVVYGSDGAADASQTPREMWARFRELPLTDAEFTAIAGNVAPYLR
jgi:predicted TIM-barrel fold metal-dependent hydrolase